MNFKIYKRGQGKYTRLCSGFGGGIIAGLGCLRLYGKLQVFEWGLDPKEAMWVSTMVPVVLFSAFGLLIFWLVNKPSIADFMILAEGEIKKVSWSSRRDITISTFVVIVVVALMAVFLWLTDLGFQTFFMWLIGY